MKGQGKADLDQLGRATIWAAIQRAAQDIAGSCTVYTSVNADPRFRIDRVNEVPPVETWRLIEVLSLLSILAKAQRVVTPHILNVLGKTGPIEHIQNNLTCFLWSQELLEAGRSKLGAKPDIVVTTSSEIISSTTTLYVVEAKCVHELGTPDIRAEFGKASDLAVTSYFMWSYYPVSSRLVEGAKRLGIDLGQLLLDGKDRAALLATPEHLYSYVAARLEESRQSHRFAVALAETAARAVAKVERDE